MPTEGEGERHVSDSMDTESTTPATDLPLLEDEAADPGTQEGDFTIINGRRAYTIRKKLQVLEDLRIKYGGNKSMCSKGEGIPRPTLISWCKEQERFTCVSSSRQESVKRVRHVLDPEEKKKRAKFPDLEAKLMEWIREQRAKGLTVNCAIIQIEAKKLFDQIQHDPSVPQPSFSASLGWVTKFLRRHDLVKRAFTSVGQKVPENASQLVTRMFHLFDEKVTGISGDNIANMDETPVYFDMPGSRTFDMRGVKTVKCKTTGHEKLRFTAVLTIMSNGQKLNPMIIFKGLKKIPPGEYPKGMIVTVASGGSMTGDLMEKYRESVWAKRPGGIFKPPSLFIMDTHRAHRMESVADSFLKKNRTELLFVDGGMTPLLQLLDVYVNKSFKTKLRAKWEDWMRNGEVLYTKFGNRQRASYQMVCKWVQEAWDEIDSDMLVNSFVGCGLVTDRSVEKLHSRLQKLIKENELEDGEDHTGISDDEETDLEENEQLN